MVPPSLQAAVFCQYVSATSVVSEEASQMRTLPDLTVGHVVLVKHFSQFFPNVLLWDGSLSLVVRFSFSSRGAKN